MGVDSVGSKPVALPPAQPAAGPAAPAQVQGQTPAAPPIAKAPESSFKPTAKEAKTRDEQLKHVDGTLQYAGVSADVKAKMMAQMKKLPPAEFDRECEQMMKHVQGPNADRAISTQQKLLEMSNASPEAKKRLTPEVRAALVDGVGNPRNNAAFGKSDPLGQAGILGQKGAEDAAKALVMMPPEQYQQTTDMLAKAGTGPRASPGADAQTEKALILKAVAARADRLGANPQDQAAVGNGQAGSTESQRAMKEIGDFANDVRGTNKASLIRDTSPLDLDAGTNDSKVNPEELRGKGGLEAPDQQGNNDGLYQRYNQSCGPTVAQMTRAEADPIYALALAKDPTLAGKDQKALLDSARKAKNIDDPAGPMPRETQQLWDNAGAAAKDKLGLKGKDQSVLRDTILGKDQGWYDNYRGKNQLAELRNADNGHPTDAEIQKMRANPADDKTQMPLETALNRAAGPSTHVTYTTTPVTKSGLDDSNLVAVDERLKRGQAVPMRMDDNGSTGHFVNVTDVRGGTPNRRYLVSDPWSGKTAWVKESELKNQPGSQQWQKRDFGLDQTRVTDFYLEK